MKGVVAMIVRLYGHPCAAIRTGLANEPLLFRARKEEAVFKSEVPTQHEGDGRALRPVEGERIARIACARLINRTETRRREIVTDQRLEDLRSTSAGRRLLLSGSIKGRRGKRWKICPVTISTPEQTKTTKGNNAEPLQFSGGPT